MTEVKKDVKLARAVKPRFLSLVGLPANQVAFKVVRGDEGGEKTVPHIARKRVRRSEAVVSFGFSKDTSDDDIRKELSIWGVTDYTVVDDEETGRRIVKCADADARSTFSVSLGGGKSVQLLKPISQQRSDKTRLSVVAIEFAKDYFPEQADVAEWCRRSQVDISKAVTENDDRQTVVRRAAVAEGEETRKIEVDSGVQFVVARSEDDDVPEAYVTVINDAAYGHWGWGQLDFAAAMADVEFCNLASGAIGMLREVAERIIFYSDLPLGVRKELIASAASQFTDFLVTLMDALPARVVVANRSSPVKENSMSKGTKGPDGQLAERQDKTDAAGAAASQGTPASDATTAVETLTRADVEKIVSDALAGITTQITELAAKLPAAAEGSAEKRSDGAADGEGAKPAADNALGETLQNVLRSVTALTEKVTQVAERVEGLENSTVVRSDTPDPKNTETKRKDVFAGVFSGGKRA